MEIEQLADPLNAAAPGCSFDEVQTRAEAAAGARNNHDPDFGVAVGLNQEAGEVLQHRAADGVHALGAVERQGEDMAVTLGEQVFGACVYRG